MDSVPRLGEHAAVIALRRPIIRLVVFGLAIAAGLALLPWQDNSLGLVLTHRMAAVPVPQERHTKCSIPTQLNGIG